MVHAREIAGPHLVGGEECVGIDRCVEHEAAVVIGERRIGRVARAHLHDVCVVAERRELGWDEQRVVVGRARGCTGCDPIDDRRDLVVGEPTRVDEVLAPAGIVDAPRRHRARRDRGRDRLGPCRDVGMARERERSDGALAVARRAARSEDRRDVTERDAGIAGTAALARYGARAAVVFVRGIVRARDEQ